MTLSTGCLLYVVLTLAEQPEVQIYRFEKRFEAGLTRSEKVWTRLDQTRISDP